MLTQKELAELLCRYNLEIACQDMPLRSIPTDTANKLVATKEEFDVKFARYANLMAKRTAPSSG